MKMNRIRPCPSLWLSPRQVLAATFRGAPEAPEWAQFAGRQMTLTQSGRTAIYFLRQALGLEKGDEVLVSAYNCGTEVDALIASGLKVRCVDSNAQGFLALDSLERAVTPQTKLVYVIHPFGWPQPMDEINEWRKESGLLLAEDCALALFSDLPDGSPIGSLGDAAIFSFPKSLPVPDGGAITWTSGWSGPTGLNIPPAGRTLRSLASLVKAWTRYRAPVRRFANSENLTSSGDTLHGTEDMPANYYLEAWRVNSDCAPVTRKLLSSFDTTEIKQQRRRNFLALMDGLKGSGLQTLFAELPEGICPCSLPIVVQRRDERVSALAALGIYSTPWWAGGHRLINWNDFPVASELKRRVLPLPVHHQLDEANMHNIAQTVRSLLRC